MSRQTFTMTTTQRDKLLEAMKPVPYMVIGTVPPRSQQQNANDAWMALGREMGFDGMSVRPGSHELEFTAEACTPAASVSSSTPGGVGGDGAKDAPGVRDTCGGKAK